MAYAVLADIVTRYSEAELLLVADRDGDGTVDVGVVDTALADASGIIDAYLGARYAIPLTFETLNSAEFMASLCVDLAMYRMAVNAAADSEQKRKRYDDVLETLRAIVQGTTSLAVSGPPATVANIALKRSNAREFTRSTLGTVW